MANKDNPNFCCLSDGLGGFTDGPAGPHKTPTGLHTNGVAHGDVNGDDGAVYCELVGNEV